MPCIGNVPTIVANGTFSVGAGPLPLTTLFTPSASGLFRVSVYITANFGDDYGLLISWTDSTGIQSTTLNGESLDGGAVTIPITTADVFIQSEADAIQISNARPSGEGLGYSVYYIVEQLA